MSTSSGHSSKPSKGSKRNPDRLTGRDILIVFAAMVFVVMGMIVFHDDIKDLRLLSRFFPDQHQTTGSIRIAVSSGAVPAFTVELARTPEEKAKGLMFRDTLPKGRGMLFTEETPRIVKMWMRNTYIPLDMIFFDGKGKIVYLHENARPFDERSIGPDFVVMAVLELPAGSIREYGLAIGDRALNFSDFYK